MGAPRLRPYLDMLNRAAICWVSGSECAMVSSRPRTIFVFPTSHETVEDLADSITHEVVHLVHPKWEDRPAEPTDRIRTKVAELMGSTRWCEAVYRRLTHEFLWMLKRAVEKQILDDLMLGGE